MLLPHLDVTQLLYDAVTQWAPVEWARGNEGPGRCPFFVWRLAVSKVDVARRIAEVVNNFEGQQRWIAYQSGRNWVIEPSELASFVAASTTATDVEVNDEFSRRFPKKVQEAIEDIAGLAAAIAAGASKWL